MTKQQAIAAIEAEPELPGLIPQDMYDTIMTLDREGLTEWCRILVRATKQGIIARLHEEGL